MNAMCGVGDGHAEPVRFEQLAQPRASCHSKGGGPAFGCTPFACATTSLPMREASAIAPCGRHADNTIRLRGAATLAISRAAATASGAKITAKTERITSAAASGSGIAAAAPSTKVTSRPRSAARAAATSRSRGAGSIPVTCAPAAAASNVALPSPHPRSTTRLARLERGRAHDDLGRRQDLRADVLVAADAPIHGRRAYDRAFDEHVGGL